MDKAGIAETMLKRTVVSEGCSMLACQLSYPPDSGSDRAIIQEYAAAFVLDLFVFLKCNPTDNAETGFPILD